MKYLTPAKAIAWSAALILVSPKAGLAQDYDGELIATAFEKAKAASPWIEVTSLSCRSDQDEITELHGSQLSYPCVIRELVETSDDAQMIVALLLAQAPPVRSAPPTDGPPLAQSVAAIGVAVAGSQLDSDLSLKRVVDYASESEGSMTPPLASFLPRDSDTFRAEVARVDRERDAERTGARTDRIARKREDERKAKESTARAEYQSVTDFLALSHAQGFCPADGRAFLARAAELSSSRIRSHQAVGLWADGRRHSLAPYLNDVSRCG